MKKQVNAMVQQVELASGNREAFLTPAAVKEMMHNLQKHQAELEMQNDELRKPQVELELMRARYFDLYAMAPVGYLTLTELGLIQESNLKAANLLGATRNALLNRPLADFILPADQNKFYRHHKKLLQSKGSQTLELRIIRAHGQQCWVKLEANLKPGGNNNEMFRLVISDISEYKAKEQGLRQAAAMFDCAREGVMVVDVDQCILSVNQAFCKLTGYPANEVLGKTPRILQSGRQDKAFYAEMWHQIRTVGYWQGEIWNRRKSGEIYPQLLSISAVKAENQMLTHYVGVFFDISHLKDTAEKLDYLAHHDPLTGLANRLVLFARLEHSLETARRDRKSLALLMLDLDRFKDVNDSYGHLAGDELLQLVAQRLTSRLRGIDTVTRLGGDEFALLLEDLSHPQDAALVAAEIIEALSEPWRLSMGVEVRIGTSIGISLSPQHGKTSAELMQQADAALYLAKDEGRGTFKYFSDDLTIAAHRRLNLEALLRRALVNQELKLYYQPQVDMVTGRIIGAEALLRWQNEVEGFISPDRFIPLAEETGLIAEIGEWVLRETCRQGQAWLDAGLPTLKLAVNLSSHQFRHGDICTTLKTVLEDTGFPAQNLELELTESALMEREAEAVLILQKMRDLGVGLAIDDFGTGYSSLAYLKRFPLDVLKIDKAFITEIPQEEDDNEIAAAIIAMAHILRLKVLAEGVETQAQMAFLQRKGCDFYQGYFMCPALPAADFSALVMRAGFV